MKPSRLRPSGARRGGFVFPERPRSSDHPGDALVLARPQQQQPRPAASPRGARTPSSVDVELETLIRARYPIIYVVSWEERRVEEVFARNLPAARARRCSCGPDHGHGRRRGKQGPARALNYVLNAADQSVFVLKDFHPFITDVAVTRRLRDLVYALKTSYKTLILLSPMLKLPPELEKEISVVDYQLPTLSDLDRLLEGIIQSVRANPQIKTDLTPLEREHVLKAAMGLTSNEAENVFAKSLVEKRGFDVDVIWAKKNRSFASPASWNTTGYRMPLPT
jgi:hypothetical protein